MKIGSTGLGIMGRPTAGRSALVRVPEGLVDRKEANHKVAED